MCVKPPAKAVEYGAAGEDVPEIDRATPWGILSYNYVNPLLAIGMQRPIVVEDLRQDR